MLLLVEVDVVVVVDGLDDVADMVSANATDDDGKEDEYVRTNEGFLVLAAYV